MQALALAVATAVIQYLVDKTDLVENVRGWLKRDPASLAYQRALLRAYAAFARSDPALAKSFFDETFLARAAVPELAKQLTRHEHANGAELARLWAASLYGDAFAEQRAQWAIEPRVVQACAQFLQWLENELKREEVFQPLFDSRALDALEAKFDELARVLTIERNEALRRAETYAPAINQIARQSSVNISDHSKVVVYGDIVGGDKIVHNYFYGNFTSLDDYYIAPDSVYRRVKIDEFVGREWLVGRIDTFLNDTSRTSGVFRIEGEAGVGKTAFLAHLVRERGYLHLFAEQVPGDNNVERALLSLGVQIVSRYVLDPYAERNTLPAIAGFSDFLYKLLNMASQRLTAGEKIIVVCDALDEAGNGTNGNVFGLPTNLPDNVYFILSQRPVAVRLDVKCEIHSERVKPDNADNLHDIQEYLHSMATRAQIAQQLRAKNYSDAEFVRILQEKSGGVWIYLQYVLDEIQRGARHPLELDKLPNGLVGYYLVYWGDWRAGRNHRGKGESEWYALYLPLLATLAVAQEPIPLDTLITWAGVNATQFQVRNLLREQWGAFITEREEQGHAARFNLYHASLRDFFTGKVDTDALSSAEINFIDELRDGAQAAHQRIVANFTERCRGNWTDLIHDDYARRYLTLHLEGAEQYETMRELVAWSDAWAKARHDKEETWSGYLTDLERVWGFAERKENIGWQIRCALIESTIHSLVGNISPELLAQLIETKLWSPARALAHIPHIPEDSAKARALEELAPLLPRELLGEALAAARGIQDEYPRAFGLRGLAAHLSAEQLREALAAAGGIQNERSRAYTLSALAAHLSAEEKAQVLGEAFAVARAIQNESERARALKALAMHLSAGQMIQALEMARAIQNEFARATALSGLAAYLTAEEKAQVVDEALAAARAVQNKDSRARALINLRAHLAPEDRVAVTNEALDLGWRPPGKSARAQTLSDLAAHLSAKEKVAVVGEALAAARAIRDESYRADALRGLARFLSAEEKAAVVGEALAAARGIREEYERARELTYLAVFLSAEEKVAAMGEALVAAQAIRDESARQVMLSDLAAYLSAEQMREALAAAQRIQDESSRARALRGLAAHLSGQEKTQVVGEVLAVVREIHDESARSDALRGLVPHLSAEQMTEALAVAREIHDESARYDALRGLAAHLSAEQMTEALALTRGLREEYKRAYALGDLAPHLSAERMTEALAVARGLHNKYWKALALLGLARHLAAEEKVAAIGEALAAARGIGDESYHADALLRLAPHLSAEEKAAVVGEALAAARGIREEYERARELKYLAVLLSAEEKVAAMGEALVAAQAIRDESARQVMLSDLAAYLSAEQMKEALAAAQRIQDESSRALALRGLAAHLSVEEKVAAMGEALGAARGIQNERSRAYTLSDLAAHLSAEQITEALAVVREIHDESARSDALRGLAAHLSAEQMSEALEAVREIQYKKYRADALRDLARYLPEAKQFEILEEVFSIASQSITVYSSDRCDSFRAIMPMWEKLNFKGFEPAMWNQALHILARHPRKELLKDLTALLPLIRHLGGQVALDEMFYALRDVGQWWP